MMTPLSDAVKWVLLNDHYSYKHIRHFLKKNIEYKLLNKRGDFITICRRTIFINISQLSITLTTKYKCVEMLPSIQLPFGDAFDTKSTSI